MSGERAAACQHGGAAPVGYTEALIERADAAVAGLVLFAGIYICPDCRELVAGVHLRPKRGGRAELVTVALPVLRPPSREPQDSDTGVQHAMRAVRHG